MKKSIVPWAALALFGLAGHLHAAAWSLSCPDGVKKLPRLSAGKEMLEPSGVAWDPALKVAVGVSDEAAPGALFAFDPSQVVEGKEGKTIQAHPLLNPAQVEHLKPIDLEGITRLPGGEFVAAASMSLNKNKPQDSMLRFRLKKGSGAQPWVTDGLARTSSGAGGLHSWLTKGAQPPWDGKFNSLDSETGINIEGIAATAREETLHFGFRGPADLGNKLRLLTVAMAPSGPPSVVKWRTLKLGKGFEMGGIMGVGTHPLGIRDLTPLEGSDYLLLLGASGSGTDLPFQMGWWREDQDEVAFVGKIPDGFRAEGVAVTALNNGVARLLLVSDKKGYVMECDAASKKK